MKISIVIPIWKGSGAIKRNLPKILETARSSKVEEVILSDDASPDDSVEVIKKQFPEVVLVERFVNGGFSSNVNTGVSRSKGDLIVLLNIDAIPDENFLKSVLPHFNNSQVFSVGCNVGGLWTKAEFKNGYFWHHQGQLQEGEKLVAHKTLWSSGGSGIFRKVVWDELGGLDTLFDPFYEEDMDLGYRAVKRGYINIWEPQSLVQHYHEKGVIEENFTKSSVSKIAQRNQLIFIWKNITSRKMAGEHKKALLKMLMKHPKYWEIFLAAAKKLPQILTKRKIEEKESKLTDEEVLRLFA